MTTLILVRHAKSDWGDPGLRDHDRPLNERGRRDAPRMAAALAARWGGADAAGAALLSSTALRARTTAAHFGAALGLEVVLRPELYGASAPELLAVAEAAGAATVIIVAHDPGLSALAERLSAGAIAHMPTCAVAEFGWDEPDWAVATALTPTTRSFAAPR